METVSSFGGGTRFHAGGQAYEVLVPVHWERDGWVPALCVRVPGSGRFALDFTYLPSMVAGERIPGGRAVPEPDWGVHYQNWPGRWRYLMAKVDAGHAAGWELAEYERLSQAQADWYERRAIRQGI